MDDRSMRGRPGVAGGRRLVAAVLVLIGIGMPGMAEASFDEWVQELWPEARAKGVSETTFRRAFDGVRPDSEVLERASRQPEFVRPIGDYIASAVSDKRIAEGRDMLRRHESILDAIEARYGVGRHIVVAIWGMESSYGAVLENYDVVRPVIRSLATLAHGGGRRAGFGRTQLLAALEILERGDVSPDRMYGSWAGAMGHTQFIPTTYQAYAVDFTGDGRRDIWTSIPDALASTANYLRQRGWRPGETWGYEVVLPDGFDFALADDARRPISEWMRHGLRRPGGRDFPRPDDEAQLMLPAGGQGPAFLMLPNFRSILAYNNANSYALAVGHLADRLAGGGEFSRAWPDDRPLDSTQRRELQELLGNRGFETGGVDGIVGPNTRAAIRSFQSSAGLPTDGHASYNLLRKLRAGS